MPQKGSTSSRVLCVCLQCGDEFTVPPSGIRRGRGKYCSRHCANYQGQGRPPDIAWVDQTCKQCGKPFALLVSRVARGDGDFCSQSCHAASRTAERNPFYRGGVLLDGHGYRRVLVGKNRYVYEHRLVAATIIGRPLLKHEAVHHRNGIRDDNRPDNLEVMTRAEHSRLHSALQGKRASNTPP